MNLLQEINAADSEQITEGEAVTVNKYVIRHKSGDYIQETSGGGAGGRLEGAKLFPSENVATEHIRQLSGRIPSGSTWEVKPVEVTITIKDE